MLESSEESLMFFAVSKALVFFAVSKQIPVVYSADRGRAENILGYQTTNTQIAEQILGRVLRPFLVRSRSN